MGELGGGLCFVRSMCRVAIYTYITIVYVIIISRGNTM